MKTFSFSLDERYGDLLVQMSEHSGLSKSDHVRLALGVWSRAYELTQSGACVTGFEIHTTSGSVWVARGF